MKSIIIALSFWILLVGSVRAEIVERVVYAVDTPLASDCRVTQTGLMELMVMPCSWTTVGEARVFSVAKSIPAQLGFGPLAGAISQGKAEWMPNGLQVRAWLRDKNGDIVSRSERLSLPISAVITVPAGNTYFIYLVRKAGPIMEAILLPVSAPRPDNYVHILAFEFEVPIGTTDLSEVTIEVFTVRPGKKPKKGLFEK